LECYNWFTSAPIVPSVASSVATFLNYGSFTIPPMCTFGNTIRYITLCGNLPSAAHFWGTSATLTFGHTITCKHILGYRQLNIFGDAVSWTHLGMPSASHIGDTISCMPSLTIYYLVTKDPYTPRSAVKIQREIWGLFIPPDHDIPRSWIPLILIET
jgi:hypothetical protein